MKRVIFISGAGLSAESGIPTFRTGTDAIWEGYSASDVCNMHTFKKNYDLVHKFYNDRRVALGKVEPNEAHKIIGDLQQKYGKDKIINLTTNVDDLLERAGCEDVLHVHGFLREMIIGYNTDNPKIVDIGYSAHTPNTDCIDKPNVVLFYESAPKYQDMYELLYDGLDKDNDIVVIIGASFVVIDFGAIISNYIKVYNINPVVTRTVGRFNNIYLNAVEGMNLILPDIEDHLNSEA